MTVQEGAVLCGRYRLQQSVGRGGMADVYLAFDSKRQSQVAVKILREDMAEDPDFVRRFRHEAEALARLDHPNIVRFYAFERDGLVAFIVMDYIAGSTLRRHLQERREPLEVKELTPILRDICSALHYAHVNGFVHRDLKPGNVMLKRDGTALLTDFGISRAVEGATLTAAAMGTPAYMSPEQIAGDAVDARSDIYSLGVLLFEMATGRRPFTGDEPGLTQTGTTARLQEAHLRLPPPDPRSVTPRLPAAASVVILRALAKNPADRWPDVMSLRGAWEAAVGAAGGVSAAVATATAERSKTIPHAEPQPIRRAVPLWALSLAGAMLLVTAVIAAVALTPRVTNEREVVSQATAPVIALATVPSSPSVTPAEPPTQKSGGVQVATLAKPTTTSPQPTIQAVTATLQPTITLRPTPLPTTAIPSTSIARATQERIVTISLKGTANASTRDGYVNPPVGDVILSGVRFGLGTGESVTTQAAPLPNNPKHASVQVDVLRPEAVYLLLTGGNLYNRFGGKRVGEVVLSFSDQQMHVVALIAGQNLREWKQGDGVISRASDPELTEVWRGTNRFDASPAVIDMLSIIVPAGLQSARLVSVGVVDLSAETVGELDPALNLLGVSVAQRPAPTAMPTRAPTSTVAPTVTPVVKACSIAVAPAFQALWQQQRPRLGCALNRVVQTDAATERFERGRMIWRKDNDMIYVLYDDGDWAVYPDISIDGAPEPEGFRPPTGLYTPVRGFGATWRARLGGIGARIGWATEAEYALPLEFQDFERGLMLTIAGKVHLLGDNGERWLAP